MNPLIFRQKFNTSRKTNKFIVLCLVCLMVTAYLFANTVYVPALPDIRRYFMTSELTAQSIIIIYIFALGISQIVYGPLSDFYGRRHVVLYGTLIFMVGDLIAMLSLSIHLLLAARFLQGLGAGSYSVIGKSITHDIFKKNSYINATIMVMIFSVLTQMLSPLAGGYLNTWFSWHANIVAVFIYTLVIFLILFLLLPETHNSLRLRIDLHHVWNNYRYVSGNWQFWSLLLISALTLGAIAIYQIVSPFLVQDNLHISSVIYGWSLLVSSGGFLIGNALLILLNRYQNLSIKISIGLLAMLLGAICMLMFHRYHLLTAIMLPALLFNVGTGIVFPLSTAGALLTQPSMPESAGAIIGSLQMLLMALIASLAAFIHIQNQYSLSIILLSITCSCILLHIYTHCSSKCADRIIRRLD